MSGVPGLGAVEQLVLRGDGLTTTSLEILTGATVTTAVRAHWRLPLRAEWGAQADGASYAGEPADDSRRWAWFAGDVLDAGAGDELLVRELDLVGGGTVLAAATLVAVLGVLPAPLAHRLGTTDEPIGRLLAAHGVAVRRELLRWGLRPAGELAGRLAVAPESEVPARTYRMRAVASGRPLAAITEWFSPAALGGAARAPVRAPRRAHRPGSRSRARSAPR
ncbi:chorismate--pyruvate lyase family protein [Actinomycetospora flava]|uniref:Chorismate lyase n=1 Tax=Actinomycetospora flava TaxID=3129232 RepID=A0ABU8MBL8_9PSEU